MLNRRTRSNPLFVGAPGVGKTALVRALARRIADGDCRALLEQRRLTHSIERSRKGISPRLPCSTSLSAKDHPQMEGQVKMELKSQFCSDLLDRMDDVVIFHALNEKLLPRIVNLQTARIQTQSRQRGLELALEPSARQFLARAGYDPHLRRPLEVAGDIAERDRFWPGLGPPFADQSFLRPLRSLKLFAPCACYLFTRIFRLNSATSPGT